MKQSNDNRTLVEYIHDELAQIKSTAEIDVANMQRELFRVWEHKRKRCIHNQVIYRCWHRKSFAIIQTKSMTLQLRLREIADEKKQLDTLYEYLHFFENRHAIEELANENRKREENMLADKASREMSDEEYGKELFRRVSTSAQRRRTKRVRWMNDAYYK